MYIPENRQENLQIIEIPKSDQWLQAHYLNVSAKQHAPWFSFWLAQVGKYASKKKSKTYLHGPYFRNPPKFERTFVLGRNLHSS